MDLVGLKPSSKAPVFLQCFEPGKNFNDVYRGPKVGLTSVQSKSVISETA